MERAALGRRVAEFVRDRYGDYGSLTEVRVGFRREWQAGTVTMKNTEVPYRFPIER